MQTGDAAVCQLPDQSIAVDHGSHYALDDCLLNAAFSAIDGQYRGADAFLCDGLMLSEELIGRFRSSVLK